VLEATLFGNAVLRSSGQEVNPPTKKALGLIAYLTLEGEVGRDRLAGLFWGGMGPDKARHNLRQELYRLSNTPLGAHLEQSPESVRLRDPVQSDVAQFWMALRAGRFSTALTLYRGELLGHHRVTGANAFRNWLEHERAVLVVARREALVGRAGEFMRQGSWREALATYLECIAEDELQEHLHREVMRLYALLGERGAALEQFERLRRALRRQVSLEPLPETVALAEQIRAGELLERVPAAPASPLAVDRSLEPPFVGRDAFIAKLAGMAGSVLVGGEPGVGKTRLVLEVTRGRALVLRGRESSTQTPLLPVAEAIRAALEGGRSLARLELVWRLEVARLVPDLEPLTVTPAAPEGRWRFVEGLARALAALIPSGEPLVFDDLQWFDAATFEVLVALRRHAQVRFVATARADELSLNVAATRFLESLERSGDLERLTLRGLDEANLERLSAHVVGERLPTDFATQLHRATAGNPLHALETMRALRDARAALAPLETHLSRTLHATVLARVDHLGAAVRRVLEAGCLSAEPFSVDLIVGASALGDWEVLDALERAVTAQLLEAEQNGYRFAHAMIREALEANLSAPRRAMLHRRLAETLETQDALQSRVADHLERAGATRRAALVRVRAAEEAATVFAYRAALEQSKRALENGLGAAQTFELHTQRLKWLENLDDREAWGEEVDELERFVARSRHLTWRASATLERAHHLNNLARFDEALQLNDTVLRNAALLPASKKRAFVQSAYALHRLGRIDEARARLETVLELLEPHEFALEAQVRELLASVAFSREDWKAIQLHNEAALTASLNAGNEYREVTALQTRARLAERQSAPNAAELFAQAYARALETNIVALQRTILLGWSAALANRGVYPEAAEKLETGLALAQEPRDIRLHARFLANLSSVRLNIGDLGGAMRAHDEAIAIYEEIGEIFQLTFERLNAIDFQLGCGDLLAARVTLELVEHAIDTHGFNGLKAWYESMLVLCDLAEGRVPDLERFERTLEHSLGTNELMRRHALCILADARLRLGDAVEALEITASVDEPPAIRAYALSVRLGAQLALRRQSASSLEEALRLLASNEVACGMKLELYPAVIHTLEQTGATAQALEVRAQAETLILSSSSTLESALRERFVTHWRTRLEAPRSRETVVVSSVDAGG
jgi:DNA-binding SARP family transcriptional activator